MTILERHWWLRVVAALLALASVPAFLVWYLAFALRFDRWHGPIVVVQGALLATHYARHPPLPAPLGSPTGGLGSPTGGLGSPLGVSRRLPA